MIIGESIQFSERSRRLIADYLSMQQANSYEINEIYLSESTTQLILWLSKDAEFPANSNSENKQDIEFIVASLQAELFHELLVAMGGPTPSPYTEQLNSAEAKMKFSLLALSGILFAGCEGFDSITTMLGVLPLPSMVTLIAGLGFSILSIVVFCGYELVQVAKSLEVTLSDAPKLLDIYLLQLAEIKNIRKKIEALVLARLTKEELIQAEAIIVMLQKRFEKLVQASTQFDTALHSTLMELTKVALSCMAGLLFFGSGFFAGQSVAMFIAGLYMPMVLPTFWPVVLFSIIIGCAALSLNWYAEQAGLKKLVSGWFGLDEDKIAELCDKNNLDSTVKKLEQLKEKIKATIELKIELSKLQAQSKTKEPSDPVKEKTATLAALNSGHNPHSFYAPKAENQGGCATSSNESISRVGVGL